MIEERRPVMIESRTGYCISYGGDRIVYNLGKPINITRQDPTAEKGRDNDTYDYGKTQAYIQ